MNRIYHGSCHCGAVRLECELDLAAGTSRCNCSICRKGRFWRAVTYADRVRVLAGEEALVEYCFASGTIRHLFCGHSGIKPFGRGEVEGPGRDLRGQSRLPRRRERCRAGRGTRRARGCHARSLAVGTGRDPASMSRRARPDRSSTRSTQWHDRSS